MDYGRFNYIAQPGDNAHLIPKIGPYDLFAVEWGYRPFIGITAPDQERDALNRIAARQEREPFLRFGDADGIDPTSQTEDLGDDAVKATQYGLANIRRIAEFLLPATTEEGEDYSTLREIYLELLGQRNRELGHVANVVGGVVRTRKVAGQEGLVHAPVPRGKQKEAMMLLTQESFRTPTELLRKDILGRIEPTGATDRVLQGQRLVLNILTDNGRMGRIIEHQALPGNTEAYRLSEMLADLRSGVWSELSSAPVKADVYRRNLQRAYLEIFNTRLNPPAPAAAPVGLPAGFVPFRAPALPGEARAIMRAELRELDALLARAIGRAADRDMKAHLRDSRDQIERILKPVPSP
jgi:hypothetical protein